MEYNKALENYKKIINNIESQIKEREDKVAELKGNIQSIKEDRKKEVKNGIFTKTIRSLPKLVQYQRLEQILKFYYMR